MAVEALIWPTLPTDGPQTVISRRDPATGAGFALVLTPDGMTLEVGDARVSVGKPLRAHTWYRVWASADTSTGMLRVGQQPLKRAFATDDEGDASLTAPTVVVEAAQPILIGAEAAKDRPAHRCFNGKIEAPAIAGIAAWDFSRRMESLEIEDTGPNGLHGRLVNLPTRAMKGASWTGAERDWKKAPHQYAAIHFHDDDLHDCGWDDRFQLHRAGRAAGAASTAWRCRARPHRDVIPFFVRPAAGKPTAKVVYLASTFTYQVYTNFQRGLFNDDFRLRVAAVEGLAATIPTTTRTTGSRPTTIIATARAWPIPRACGRCSPGGRTSWRCSTSAARACATCRPIRISPAGSTSMGVDFDVVTDHDLTPRARRCSRPTRSC